MRVTEYSAPTQRERALFAAATTGSPREFVRLCRLAGTDPKDALDSYEGAPWRWFVALWDPSEAVIQGLQGLEFPPDVEERLAATRKYVETPWWRRRGR
jgi:hypothetical protein